MNIQVSPRASYRITTASPSQPLMRSSNTGYLLCRSRHRGYAVGRPGGVMKASERAQRHNVDRRSKMARLGERLRVAPGTKVDLASIDPNDTHGRPKRSSQQELADGLGRLTALQ